MSTHFHGSTGENRALATFIKLMRAADTVLAVSRRIYAEAGLTDSQFGVLEALLHLGPLTPGELGKKILKSAGNLTLVIDNLVKHDLIERRESREDRRQRPVSLTAKGRELIQNLFPQHVSQIVRVMSALAEHEQDQLSDLLRKLGKHSSYTKIHLTT